MELEYELVNSNNIKLATSIQHTIFPNACAYVHYKYSIDTNYETNMYYIIRLNEIPVGVIGLYTEDEIDNESIWLGWFGILPEFRSRGIGRKSILEMIERAKKSGRKYFRLYTDDKEDSIARPLYRSVMQVYENYNNEKGENFADNCLVYSYSLCDEKVKLWNSKFMNLKQEHEEERIGNDKWKSKYRILILSNSWDEEFIENLHIATAFREDGHIVNVCRVNNIEKSEDEFDIVIKRHNDIKNKYELIVKDNKIKEYVEQKISN